MAINGFLHSFHTTFLFEMVSAQKAEIIVWVDMIQRENQVY